MSRKAQKSITPKLIAAGIQLDKIAIIGNSTKKEMVTISTRREAVRQIRHWIGDELLVQYWVVNKDKPNELASVTLHVDRKTHTVVVH